MYFQNNTTHRYGSTGKEHFVLKGVSKEDAQILSSQMSNFCKLYGNTEGNSVIDGRITGGVFTKNVWKIFASTKFILKHEWSDILQKIREYTKRVSTTQSDVNPQMNMTQLVETESTLERPLYFGSKYLNLTPTLSSQLQEVESNVSQLTITNLSYDTNISLLVEMKRKDDENRVTMLETIANSKSATEAAKTSGFTLISNSNSGKYNDHTFKTEGESTYVSCINLTYKEVIYDRHYFRCEHLYFIDNKLIPLIDLRPKCNNILKPHYLMRNDYSNNDKKCNKCKTTNSEVYYCCYSCEYSLCSLCCHLSICEKHSNLKDGDVMTVATQISGISGISSFSKVSSVAGPYTVRNLLVAVLGIGLYNGQSWPWDLPGVSKDYNNILSVFTKVWNYNVFYWVNTSSTSKNDENKESKDNSDNNDVNYSSVYTNDLKIVKNNSNFKLRWNENEISNFVESVRKCMYCKK